MSGRWIRKFQHTYVRGENSEKPALVFCAIVLIRDLCMQFCAAILLNFNEIQGGSGLIFVGSGFILRARVFAGLKALLNKLRLSRPGSRALLKKWKRRASSRTRPTSKQNDFCFIFLQPLIIFLPQTNWFRSLKSFRRQITKKWDKHRILKS
jgi:hypothetical protein